MLQKLSITNTKKNPGNTSKNLLNENSRIYIYIYIYIYQGYKLVI